MFRKQHRVKSNTQLKSSEKKKIINKVQTQFKLENEDLQLFFPSKESVSVVKIITNLQEIVAVYSCQEIPLFYEIEEHFHPTIFALWIYPQLIPFIRVYSGVIQHLISGADLMIPGIMPNQEHLEENLPAGTLFYICTEKNIAAVGVGVSLIGSCEMVRLGNKGKAVNLFHTFNDELSKMYESGNKEIPELGEFSHKTRCEDILKGTEKDSSIPETDNISSSEMHRNMDESMTMDELLLYCFVKAFKKYEIALPILTNIFYKNYMLDVLPKNYSLDIKKTKYKKLSTFLAEMSNSNIIFLEDNKGVQSITFVDINHNIFCDFMDKFKEEQKQEVEKPKTMEIIEKNIINSRHELLCSKFNYKKGDALADHEVRKLLTEYIKAENLNDPVSKEYVTLNGPLCDILQTKDLRMSWKNLFDSFLKKMSKCYEVRTPNNQVITGKGKLSPIELTVAVKTSNKKVTLVKNLELYGINIHEFSKECQHGVAASSTINILPNSKSSEFQIQGNQKLFIGKLLQEKYSVPKKYINGLEEHKVKKK